MNCKEIQNELSAYLDGELDPAMEEGIESHLAACIVCHREADNYKQMDDDFRRNLPPVDPSPAVLVRSLERISHRAAPGVRNLWRAGWAVIGAAAITILLMFGAHQWREYHEEQAILQRIDSYSARVPIRNVFSLSRYDNKSRDPFDYRSNLAGRSPFQIVTYKGGPTAASQRGE